MKNATSRARNVNVKCRVQDGMLSIPLQQLGSIATKELGGGGGAAPKAQRGRPKTKAAGAD